ncbi:MAG: M20 family metallopeptidase [Holophaga sp.]|nr:M20 family metallopeptidase [Holophaga sp.]
MTPQTREDPKSSMVRTIDHLQPELAAMSDFIFDHPEIGLQEVEACGLLCDFLAKNGFAVERGYAGLPTAFRAVHRVGAGGPRIGLLCEYDALAGLGHACAHHLQGPSIIGAAMAVKDQVTDRPYSLEVIGTPAEETAGGKVSMLEHGAFKDLDVALMMHGNDVTQVDLRALALSEFLVTFHGTSAHAAMAPEDGRSALEALMLVFNGLAFLRGHVRDDTRMHGIIEQGGQAVNAIPDHAVARIEVRSYNRPYLDQVIERVQRIFEGAALMTGTRFTVEKTIEFHSKIPVRRLNDLVMDNARRAGAKAIEPPRERTGSTDFANVMYYIPGSCINLPFVDKGISAHSQGYLDRGKSPEAHDAIALGAKILAMTALDLLLDPALLEAVKTDFRQEKARLLASVAG